MNRRKETRGAIVPVLTVCLLLGAAGGLFYYLYQDFRRRTLDQAVQDQLITVADMTVRSVSQYRGDRLRDAQLLLADPLIRLQVSAFLRGGGYRENLGKWLTELLGTNEYTSATIWDKAAVPRLSVPAGSALIAGETAIVREALRRGGPMVTDLYHTEGASDTALFVVVPLPPEPHAASLGALFLRIDARHSFYRHIRSRTVQDDAAATFLLRREDGTLLNLSGPPYRGGAALKLQLPMVDSGRIEAQAALAREGIVRGIDYRGVPVTAVIRRAPSTNWILVVKKDIDELYAPVRLQSRPILLAAFLLAVAIGILNLLLWHRHKGRLYQQRHEAEVERRTLVQHYAYLSRYAHDIIFLLDEKARILKANDRTIAAYGYSKEELLGMEVQDLRAPAQRDMFHLTWDAAQHRRNLVFETEHRRKDGSTFPVGVSMRLIDAGGGSFRQAIVRDISEREVMEEHLRQSEERFRQVVEGAPEGIFV